jgi:uncharacterized phage-associated protein
MKRQDQMPTPHDVAKYILYKSVPMTTLKLLKLVYYAQAWSLVWDDEPLFEDEIEAWARGPVVPALYSATERDVMVSDWRQGNIDALTEQQKKTIDKVLEFYGPISSQVLSDLTHDEEPWLQARGELSYGKKSRNIITKESMKKFYSSL